MSNRKMTVEQYEFLISFAPEYFSHIGGEKRVKYLSEILRLRNIKISIRHAQRIMTGKFKCRQMSPNVVTFHIDKMQT